MISIQNTITTLIQSLNTVFATNDTVKQFSHHLTELFSKATCSCLQKRLGSVEKRWSLLCQEHTPSSPTEKIARRLHELNGIVKEEHNNPCAPPSPPNASTIIDLLANANVKEQLKNAIPEELRKHHTSYPKAFDSSYDMVLRIMQGQYGLSCKNILLDSAKTPLNVSSTFLEMLLLDQLMQNKDPQSTIEWFGKSSQKGLSVIKRAIGNFINTLTKETGLSDKNAKFLVLTGRAKLPKEISLKIAQIVGKAYITNPVHLALLEHVRAAFNPSQKQLFHLSLAISQTHPERAFSTALLLYIEEKPIALAKVLLAMESLADAKLESLKATDALLWQKTTAALAKIHGDDGRWDKARNELIKLQGTQEFVRTLRTLAKATRSELVTNKSSYYQQKQAFVLAFVEQVIDSDQKMQIIEKLIKVEVCESEDTDSILDSYQKCFAQFSNRKERFLATSALVFLYFKYEKSINFAQVKPLVASIEDTAIRKQLLEQLIDIEFHDLGSDLEATAASKKILQEFFFLSEEERNSALGSIIHHLSMGNKQAAKAMLKEITDPLLRTHVRRLLSIPDIHVVEQDNTPDESSESENSNIDSI